MLDLTIFRMGKDIKTYSSERGLPWEITVRGVLVANGATLCYNSPATKKKERKKENSILSTLQSIGEAIRQSIRENACEMGKWGELKFPWSGLPEQSKMETERIKEKTLSSFGVTSVLSCMRADSLQVVKETMPNFSFFPWSSQRCFPVSLIFDQMCLISVVLITFPKSGLGAW